MQAGKTKAERKASQEDRRSLRPYLRFQRTTERVKARKAKRIIAARIEAGRAEFARPSHIKAVKEQYRQQCVAFEQSKIQVEESVCQPDSE